MNRKLVCLLFMASIVILGVSSVNYGAVSHSGLERIYSTPLDEERWESYENEKHYYRLTYPASAIVTRVEEMEPGGLEQSGDIRVEVPGEGPLVQVSAWADNAPLGSFATLQHQRQIEDANPYVDKHVGDLEQISFKGEQAYTFTLTGSFVGPRGGYALPKGVAYRYIVVEHGGAKLILANPVENELSQKLVDSFEFIEKQLTPS